MRTRQGQVPKVTRHYVYFGGKASVYLSALEQKTAFRLKVQHVSKLMTTLLPATETESNNVSQLRRIRFNAFATQNRHHFPGEKWQSGKMSNGLEINGHPSRVHSWQGHKGATRTSLPFVIRNRKCARVDHRRFTFHRMLPNLGSALPQWLDCIIKGDR